MGISDLIAAFILQSLEAEDGATELSRNELANQFGCVPSQISYVISTRFSPEHGYIVESRRGGGGYIRIRRVSSDPQLLIMHTINSMGSQIDRLSATALISNLFHSDAIDEVATVLLEAAISENALKPVPFIDRNASRASILKQMLVNLV